MLNDLITAGNAMADFLSAYMDEDDYGEFFDEIRGLLLDWDKAVTNEEEEKITSASLDWRDNRNVY
jgi:hypothetical protein